MGCEFSSSAAASRAQQVLSTVQNGRGVHGRPSETFSEFRSKGIVTDLNLNDPDLQLAATRIQASYRGHRTRNSLNNKKGKMAQEEEVDIDLNDPDVKDAAQKIQNSFRGHQARKQAQKKDTTTELSANMKKLNTNATTTKPGTTSSKTEPEEELPDLTDPELNKAATMIQAQFRGHMGRGRKKNTEDKPGSQQARPPPNAKPPQDKDKGDTDPKLGWF